MPLLLHDDILWPLEDQVAKPSSLPHSCHLEIPITFFSELEEQHSTSALTPGTVSMKYIGGVNPWVDLNSLDLQFEEPEFVLYNARFCLHWASGIIVSWDRLGRKPFISTPFVILLGQCYCHENRNILLETLRWANSRAESAPGVTRPWLESCCLDKWRLKKQDLLDIL